MKYHVTLDLAGTKVRMKNVEATNQQDAEEIALERARESIKVVGSCIAVERESNATQIPPVSGEDMFRQFFGKS